MTSPQLTSLVNGQPVEVEERVWGKVTDAYRQFLDAEGRVRTGNQAVWVTGTR